MIWMKRASRSLVAFVALSLVLSMIGAASPISADVPPDENNHDLEESADVTVGDVPDQNADTTDEDVPEEGSEPEESVAPPAVGEGEGDEAAPGDGSGQEETIAPPTDEETKSDSLSPADGSGQEESNTHPTIDDEAAEETASENEPEQADIADPDADNKEVSEDAAPGDGDSSGASTPDAANVDDGMQVSTSTSLIQPLANGETTVTVQVVMADGGDVPTGVRAYIVLGGDNTWTHLENLPVPADGVVTFTNTYSGRYVVGITGNGYSPRAQSANLTEEEHLFTFNLSRLTGTISATMVTSDGGDIPAGTTWALTHEHQGILDSGVFNTPLPGGSAVPITEDPLPFGVYSLSFEPPSEITGRHIESRSVRIELTRAANPDVSVQANLNVIVPTSELSFSVDMSDSGVIPAGLQWSLTSSEYSNVIADGSVTTSEIEVLQPVQYGQYNLSITGNGYSVSETIDVYQPSVNHAIEIDRLYGTVILTLTTSDGADIPAGTAWEIRDANDALVQSGVFSEALSSGTDIELDEPLEYGIYTLNIAPDVAGLMTMALEDLPRELLPFSTTVSITDPTVTAFPVAAELQWAQSTVTFTVSMADGGPLPNGLEWMLVQPPDWTPLASGDVPAGEALYSGQISAPVPYGVYQLWVHGHGYESGKTLRFDTPGEHHIYELDRQFGNVTLTLETTDDASIPAGTTWAITDSSGTVVQEGALTEALLAGSILPIANPLEFDIYTLTLDAEGYLPFSREMSIINSWVSEYPYTAELRQELSEISFTVGMSDDGSLPNGLEWSLVATNTGESLDSGVVTAGERSFADTVVNPVPNGVYELRVAGHGYAASQVFTIDSGDTHLDLVLDRRYVDLTLVLNTSDGGEVPAGTTWSIVDSAGNTVQNDELADALADGSNLPISSPLEFDVYTLVINADGYHSVSMGLSLIDPELDEATLTVNLVSDREPVPDPSPTPDPTPDQSPDPVVPTPTPTPTSSVDDSTPQTVTALPQTGAGTIEGPVMVLLWAGSIMTLVAGILLRIRYRSTRI